MSIRTTIVAALVGLGLGLAAGTAAAEDLRLSLGAAGEYDSNIFHRETKVRDDFVVIGIPRLELLDSEGKFTYDVAYSFPYQHSIKTNALRDFNHLASLAMDYHLSDQTQFSFSNDFRYVDSLSNNFDQTPGIADNKQRQQVLTNDAALGMVYRFSPRFKNETSFVQQVYSTSQKDRSDNQDYSVFSSLDYLVSERHWLGAGASFSYQNFDDALRTVSNTNYDWGGIPQAGVNVRQDVPHVTSIFVGPYVQWLFQIDEQSRLRLRAGPNYVHSQQDAIDVTALNSIGGVTAGDTTTLPSGSDSRVAVLGSFLLDRRWSPTQISALTYTRRQDTAQGVSGSAILDAVSLTHTWNFLDTWTLGMRGDWTQRKGATKLDQGGIDDLDTQRWGAGGVLTKQITRNFSGSLRYQYSKQHSQANSAGSTTDFDAHIVTLGFNYSLDPIKVW